jgi:choline dehydrogenase-like flavoprotein
MGSARVGASAAVSACKWDGETWELPGLYVMDGSSFPSASGVNPMLTIEAIAHMNASRLAAELT